MEGALLNEDIHDSLKAVFDEFDNYCRQNSILYNIVQDEPDRQGYVVHDRSHTNQLYDYLTPVTKDKNVLCKLNHDRPDGVLFVFTLHAIGEGYWKVLSSKPKRHEFSIFAKDSDAKKVRAGKALGQKFHSKLNEALVSVEPSWKNKSPQDMTREELRQYWQAEGGPALARAGYDNFKSMILVPRLTKQLQERGLSAVEATQQAEQLATERASQLLNLDVNLEDIVAEGQYKFSNSKHLRSQSAFRSSIGKSKSFGGIRENTGGAIAGSSIPPQIERSSNIGVSPADRTADIDGKNRPDGGKVRPYSQRKNAVDNPVKLPVPGESYDPKLDPKLGQMETFLMRIDERLSSADENERSIITNKQVPDAMEQPANPVVPDDMAAKQAMDPSGGMQNPDVAQANTLTPLGMVLDPQCDTPQSNVRTSNLRGFDGPRIATQTPGLRSLPTSTGRAAVPPGEIGPMNMPPEPDVDYKQPGVLGKKRARVHPVKEGVIARPEDGYDLMQQLIRELGLVAEARKVLLPDRIYVKACDGELRLEYDEPPGVAVYKDGKQVDTAGMDLSALGGEFQLRCHQTPGKLTVYRHGKILDELSVDLSKNTIVDEVVSKVLKLIGS